MVMIVRKVFIYICVILISNNSFGQIAFDGEVAIGFSGRIVNFYEADTPIISTTNFSYFGGLVSGASSISDLNGKLAVACSGYLLSNGLGDTILYGRQLNPPKIRFKD